jgi:HK97 gp10 family phage protein
MKQFRSLEDLARKLAEAPARVTLNVSEGILKTAVKVQGDAQKKFGTYQPAVGDFPAWTPLSEQTVAAKLKAGASGDDPLIGHSSSGKKSKTTNLRGSILVHVEGLTGIVGTNDEVAEWQEFGTKHIPPRPFLRPAVFENHAFLKEEMQRAIVKSYI